MIELVERHRGELEALCRRYHVKRLEVFGSAAAGTFDPATSDLDFLVEFLAVEPGRIAPDYFGLLHALEDLFGRKVDLVMDSAIRNPYFRRGVDESRTPVYAT
ncbi:MAG TPA: nucleotidyltransferase family protein [Gemmataceae bacterium]|nr:nucleotidyltransferase family protein [Gemmataceae bacterium]